MTTGSILIGLALLILVGLLIAQPLLMPEERQSRRSRSRRQMLLAQKEALLEEVRALDFDYETGKIPAEVYEPQRADLVALAADVLKQLDILSTLPDVETAVTQLHQSPTDDIEQAIARLRRQPKPAEPTNGKAHFCPQCGHPVDAGDKFCAVCGHQLAVTAV
ncbi:MAG: zinc ribbon domain-containing protein [Chloroflexi bacterium]|nr:zinc ribbon domain-containing protein [Chloroflexota bacterium]